MSIRMVAILSPPESAAGRRCCYWPRLVRIAPELLQGWRRLNGKRGAIAGLAGVAVLPKVEHKETDKVRMRLNKILLEVCVDDAEGLAAAIEGGADRIELCSALAIGGLTPSIGLMQLSAKAPIPVMVMIRPRAGSFIWSEDELQIMEAEIAATRALGLPGVVIGANLPDGRLDQPALQRLVKAADGLEIALHRSIDLTPDVVEAVEIAKQLGVNRILSSGGAQKAVSGLERLATMHKAAGDEIVVMPGSGVNIDTLPTILAALPDI
ncbi:copper homeostasis protein CutC, partial [Ochrobactrum quorumnocens]|uniref:copper homeostasis protein CutC n=1 Tax=Ochrobactrum quorumnocens TaxID=271865 RepID=UPI003852915D